MPMKRERYPADWEAISLSIRAREGNCCKWCGVPNGETGARDRNGEWHSESSIENMNSTEGLRLFGEFPKLVKIILTVAHLGAPLSDGQPGDKHNKMDCRPENLAALCQRCHLNYDRDEHVLNAAITRRRLKIEAGQSSFLDEALQ